MAAPGDLIQAINSTDRFQWLHVASILATAFYSNSTSLHRSHMLCKSLHVIKSEMPHLVTYDEAVRKNKVKPLYKL